jgi:indole-3-glycerol phosphate synthase
VCILDEILAVKRAEVAALRAIDDASQAAWARLDLREVMAVKQAASRDPLSESAAPARRSMIDALRRPAGAPVRVLAEVKRASPSAGPIRPSADPVAVAREYAAAGAAAISVLTDRGFFGGHISFLEKCRAAVDVPILRKDFLIDPLQLAESPHADAVLLIVAALSEAELQGMLREARGWHEVLVEVHSLDELEVALRAPRPPKLIGVNHRDLKTFKIDMTLTEQIARRVPPDVVLVAESGIRTREDVRRLGDAGAHAVLVGEQLMRAPSPGAALRELLA